jgi:hypothetical protein
VAVDGAGNIFIADTGNTRVVEIPTGGGTQITVGSGLSSPTGVAVDGAGDVFVADSNHNRVVKVKAAGVQTTVGSGLNHPIGVAVDAAGDVYIADSGNKRLVEVPADGSAQTTVGNGLNNPFGVAVDGAGNIFVGDGGGSRVVQLQRSQPPTLSFASTPVGSTSSDSPQAVTVQSIGNRELEGYPPVLGTADFVEAANPGGQITCLGDYILLMPGASCQMRISFEPQSEGNLTATLILSDNALDLNAFDASQVITLQGKGLPTVQSTATVLWSSLDPSTFGAAVTFTATVIPQVGGQATGTVTFKNGAATLATVAVSGNVASLTTSALTVGTHSITAVYSGNVNYSGSTSMPVSQLVQSATAVGTTTSLTSSVNPSLPGKPVLFTATVSPQSGTGTPTGKVTFYNGAMALATVGLSSGIAKYSTTALPAGSNTITAVYGGDANDDASTSAPVNQLVKATPIVTITPSPNPSAYGQTVYLVATVTSSVGNPPDGETVTFKHGAAVLGTANLSSGAAIFTTSTLAVGTDAVTAVYSGDSNFAGGTSTTAKQVVNKATSTTLLVSSLNPSTVGQAVTFTATVAPQFTGTPAGTVTFRDGTTTLGTEKVSGGLAKLTTSKLASGAHGITATYNGSTSFSSSSAALTQTVN